MATIKNPTYWKRMSALERGLTVAAISGVLVYVALIIGIAVIASNSDTRNKTKTKAPEICCTDACIHTASKVLKYMDKSVQPCDDFYRFACGQFLKTTIIPDDMGFVEELRVIDDHVHEQLRTIIEEPSPPNEPKPFKLAKNLYKSCINTTEIEKRGADPLLHIFKKLGGWPVLEGEAWEEDEFDWRNSTFILRDMGYSVKYFLSLTVGFDLKNSTKRVIQLDPAFLGLPQQYLSQGIGNTIVEAYYNYMVDVATILGANRDLAKKELMESLEFEMQLANISLPNEKRRNATLLYNPMTVAELNENYSFVNWMEYLSRFLPSTVRVEEDEMTIVNVPSYIKGLGELLANVPKRVQANYVMWRVAAESVSYLGDNVRNKQLTYLTAFDGITKREPRWKECVDIAAEKFSLSIGALYIRKYFNKDAKKKAEEIVHDIRVQFDKILNNADWLDDVTRKSALEKAASMSTHIAYSDELLDDKKLEGFYNNLEVSENDYLLSVLNITLFDTEYSFGKLRKPVNKSDWENDRPAVVDAFYHPIKNIMLFPAGILQGAFFNNDRPRYMNYGAIGSVIGHEITHGFDDFGRQFDKEGNLVDWWAPSTKEKYLENAECIINQYGNYTVEEVGLQLNGINTQGENIADNGGVKVAYWAYHDWSKRNDPEGRLPGLDQYSPRQMFWISYANILCSINRPKSLTLDIKTNSHSPSEFRVLGTLQNMEEFTEDFQCPVGSKMNPRKKCAVW